MPGPKHDDSALQAGAETAVSGRLKLHDVACVQSIRTHQQCGAVWRGVAHCCRAQRSAVVQPCAAPLGAVQCSQVQRSAVVCVVAHQAMSLPKTFDVYTMDAPAVRVSAANSM
jgi:hypothetical protein